MSWTPMITGDLKWRCPAQQASRSLHSITSYISAPTVVQAYETWNQRVPTARLNRWLVKVRRCTNALSQAPAPRALRCRQ